MNKAKGWKKWCLVCRILKQAKWKSQQRIRTMNKKRLALGWRFWFVGVCVQCVILCDLLCSTVSKSLKILSQSLTKASQNTWTKAEDQLRSLVGTWLALGRSWKRYDKAVKHMDRKWLLEDWAYMRSNSKKVKSAKWFAGHALRQICKKQLQLYWMVLQELMDKAADWQLAGNPSTMTDIVVLCMCVLSTFVLCRSTCGKEDDGKHLAFLECWSCCLEE